MTPPVPSGRPAPGRGTAGRAGRILLFAFLLPAWFAAARSHAVEGSDIERPAYVAMVLADEALGEGERARAAKLYQEALDAFVGIRREHPGYKSDAIGFRMKYCRDRISEIMSGEIPAAAETPAAPEPPAEPAVPSNAVEHAAAPAPGAAQEDAEAMSMRARADEMIRRIREERAHAQAETPAPSGTATEKHGKPAPPAHDTTALEQKIIALSAATNEAGRARAATEERIRELTARAEAAEAEIRALQQQPDAGAGQAAKAGEETAASRREVEEARRETDEARRTGESLRASLTALTRKCEELAREREELQTKLAKATPEKPAPAAASEKVEAELAALRRQLTETAAERDRLRKELSSLRTATPAPPATAAQPAAEGARADEQLRLLESAIANRDRENFELKAKIGRLQQDLATAGLSGAADGRSGGQTTAEAVRAERERLMRLFADEREALQMSQKILEQQVQSLISDLRAARKAAQAKPER